MLPLQRQMSLRCGDPLDIRKSQRCYHLKYYLYLLLHSRLTYTKDGKESAKMPLIHWFIQSFYGLSDFLTEKGIWTEYTWLGHVFLLCQVLALHSLIPRSDVCIQSDGCFFSQNSFTHFSRKTSKLLQSDQNVPLHPSFVAFLGMWFYFLSSEIYVYNHCEFPLTNDVFGT